MAINTEATNIWNSIVRSDIPSYHSLGFGTETVGNISLPLTFTFLFSNSLQLIIVNQGDGKKNKKTTWWTLHWKPK